MTERDEPAQVDEPAPAEDQEHDQPQDEPAEHTAPVDTAPTDTAPFGHPGQALGGLHSPFYIGFFGALGVLVALALQSVLAAASSVIVLVVVALFLAVGLNPVVELLIRSGVRRGISIALVFTGLLVTIVLFGVALVPVISDQVSAIVAATPDLVNQLKSNTWINEVNERFNILDRISQEVRAGDFGAQLAGGVLDVSLAVLGALANTLIVVILALYFLAALPRMKRSGYQLVPASRRARVSALGDEILRRVGGYVGGAFVIALLAGVTSAIFLVVVGLGDYAVALAFVVMLLDFIPLIGATIGAVIVSAIGFAVDPRIGLACVIFYLVYQQVENYLIYPRVMSNSVDVPGAVVMVAVLAGGALLGVLGALLAIPIAAGLLLIMREVLIRRQDAR
ncbi:MAG: AI-2E family transporter [Nocardioidaceae bacterium]